MIVQRFFDPKLAQTSYLIGCGRSGVGIVIDPHRDVEMYLRAARMEGVRIAHVTETHIHADFVSGSRALARRTGATLHLSDEGGPDWRYGYAASAEARLLHHGDRIEVGNVVLEAVHTPGHTPEHLSFLVTDTAAADKPIAIVSGDFVFVGDVGRPDLLERAAGGAGTMEPAARALRRSLVEFQKYPDWMQIWPGHGAGSACGKGLSAVPHSTVGYERRFNWALAIADEQDFVRSVLSGQPEPPRYFAIMKRINRDGPPLEFPAPPARLPAAGLASLLASGALVVDTRPTAAFAAGHAPGTLGIPLDRSFTTWAGSLIPYDRDFHLIVEDPESGSADEASHALAMIGLDRVAGVFGADALGALEDSGVELSRTPRIDPAELAARLEREACTLVDVRGASEWDSGYIPGARHIPLGSLAERIAELPRDRPLVVQCQSGSRSVIAAALLEHLGRPGAADLTGGMQAWRSAGLAIVPGGTANVGSG